MGEGTAPSRIPSGKTPEAPPHLRLVASAEEPTMTVPVTMGPAPLRIVLSPSGDVLGVAPWGWIGAALLFALTAALFWNSSLRITPPILLSEPQTVFHVIIERPPAAAPPAQPAPPPPKLALPAPAPAPTSPPKALPLPPPPLPALEPAPPPPKPEAPAATAAQPLPAPPPAKPLPPRALPRPSPVMQAERPPVPSRAAPGRASPSALEPMLPPRPIAGLDSNRSPDYPALARRRGEQGRVLVRVEVSTAGLPTAVTVGQSSGYAALDHAALDAVRQWRFMPATRGGIAVVGIANVPIVFRLEN